MIMFGLFPISVNIAKPRTGVTRIQIYGVLHLVEPNSYNFSTAVKQEHTLGKGVRVLQIVAPLMRQCRASLEASRTGTHDFVGQSCTRHV